MSDTISFTDLTDNRVYQRGDTSGNLSAYLSVSGTYGGSFPTAIEAEVLDYSSGSAILPWLALAGSTIGSGTWSGLMVVPQGGPYKVMFRSKVSSTVLVTSAAGTSQFFVGDLFIVAGSSTADHFFFDGDYTLTQTNCRRYYTTNSGGIPAGNQVWSQFPGSGNGAAVNFCNKMGAALGVPIGICGFGVSASYLNVWQSGQTNYTTMVSGISTLGGNVKGIFYVILNDLGNSNVFSESNWESRYKAVINNTRGIFSSVNPNIPIIILSYPPVTAAGSDTDATYVWAGEKAISIYDTKKTLVIWRKDRELNATDQLHPSTAGILDDSERMIRAWLYWKGQSGYTYYQGPKVSTAWYSGTTVTVLIGHTAGTNFTPTSGITGWTALDGSGALTVSSVAQVDPVTIQFTINRSVSGTLKVRHAWTADPDISGMIHDNASPLTLPLEPCEIVASSGTPTFGTFF